MCPLDLQEAGRHEKPPPPLSDMLRTWEQMTAQIPNHRINYKVPTGWNVAPPEPGFSS